MYISYTAKNKKRKTRPKDNRESSGKFFQRFGGTDILLQDEEQQAVEKISGEYSDHFARHRMYIGMNTEFKVKLTPEDDKAACSESLPMPIHLEEDLVVEITLLHKYGKIKILPFSNSASPFLEQRKPNGKLFLLVDLRKIKSDWGLLH